MKPTSSLLPSDQTSSEIAWLSVRAAVRRYTISRSKFYELLSANEIKSCVLRRKGAVRGKRLLSAESIDSYLECLATGGQKIQSE